MTPARDLDAARRWGPIFPMSPAKRPYTPRGSGDATRDETTIGQWWARWPDAAPALLTGEASGIVAIDVDIKNGRNGLDSLEALGVMVNPKTPTAHTPSGGIHWLFRWPGHFVKTSVDRIGPGIEIKGDRSWVTLPPGPGRRWDAHLGPSTALAALPPWAILPEPPPAPARSRPAIAGNLSRYGEAALDAAVKNITDAPAGAQEITLNKEAFAIGGLVAGGGIPAGLALDSLQWAARRMPCFDSRRPWRPAEIERKVRDAFTAGLRVPRAVAHG